MNYYEHRPELVTRTREFALRAVGFYTEIPKTPVGQILGKQMLRSATSAGAQYREAQRAKSIADFVSKSEGALQELEETAYWLELIEGAGLQSGEGVKALYIETCELVSIFVALVRTAKKTRGRT